MEACVNFLSDKSPALSKPDPYQYVRFALLAYGVAVDSF